MNTTVDLRKVRSILSVPAHDERKVAKARTRGADLIMWDMESSVPPGSKDVALAAVEIVARRGDAVRVNRGWRRFESGQLRDRDLIFVVPFVESVHDISFLESEKVVALIETPVGIVNLGRLVEEAAQCTIPLLGLAFGRWDFEAEVGFPCSNLIDYVRMQLVLAAHAAGIACWDAPSPLAVDTAWYSRSQGFTGKGCVHPSQIADVHHAWEIPAGWNPLPFAARAEEVVA